MPTGHGSPCPPRKRYVSKARVVQRGLDPHVRHVENLTPLRFALPSDSRQQICVPPTEGHVGQTRCYAEHSPRRKNCPILSANGDANDVAHPLGLYVLGLPPYDEHGDHSTRMETLIFGPYPTDDINVGMSRVSFGTVFGNHSIPENVAPRFTVGRNVIIPSVDVMISALPLIRSIPTSRATAAATALELHFRKENFEICTNELVQRKKKLSILRSKCIQRADLMKAVRRILQNVFMFAMYARRWAGPGTPYPISVRETRRLVGTHKPISPKLEGMAVYTTPTGDVKTRALHSDLDSRADTVENGKAMAMMDIYLLAVFTSIEAVSDASMRDFLKTHLLLAIPHQCTDGSYWPAEELLWDALFGVAQSTTCIRQVSAYLLHTCKMLAPMIYKTQPPWMFFEGVIDEIQ